MKQRTFKSIKDELIKKSREAMLAAVQIYNNPAITFKAEAYITLSNIAWTYLIHAYYRSKKIDYRFFEQRGQTRRKRYDRTKHGAYKYWDLESCLNRNFCPFDIATITNLKFLIGLRHEIEHQMTERIDELISAKTHASALNFNYYIKELFGNKYGIDNELALCIQFSKIEQTTKMKEFNKMRGLNENIKNYVVEFEKDLGEEIYSDSRYAYRVAYVQVNANHQGQADAVVRFVKMTSEKQGQFFDTVLVKEKEKDKYLPKEIVQKMQAEGFTNFKMHNHTQCWKELSDKKENLTDYGTLVSGTWYWYDNWIEHVREYCRRVYSE